MDGVLDECGSMRMIRKCVDTIHKAFQYAAKQGVPLIVFAINLIDLVLHQEKVSGNIIFSKLCAVQSFIRSFDLSTFMKLYAINTLRLKLIDCKISDAKKLFSHAKLFVVQISY